MYSSHLVFDDYEHLQQVQTSIFFAPDGAKASKVGACTTFLFFFYQKENFRYTVHGLGTDTNAHSPNTSNAEFHKQIWKAELREKACAIEMAVPARYVYGQLKNTYRRISHEFRYGQRAKKSTFLKKSNF